MVALAAASAIALSNAILPLAKLKGFVLIAILVGVVVAVLVGVVVALAAAAEIAAAADAAPVATFDNAAPADTVDNAILNPHFCAKYFSTFCRSGSPNCPSKKITSPTEP